MDFLKKAFDTAKKAIGFNAAGSGLQSFPMAMRGFENLKDSLNLKIYSESLYLYIGVSLIQEDASGIDWDLYEILDSSGQVEEITDHEVIDLIEKPNKNQTRKEFFKLSVAYYLLSGETFWYLDRENEGEMPNAIANMRPDYVQIDFNPDKTKILGYKFTKANGEIQYISPENVLHFKNTDPTNESRGIGVINPATERILTEQKASQYQKHTFENSGRPDVAVFTSSDMNDEKAKEARQKWNKIYNGETGSAAGFFGAEVEDIKELNADPKEMEYIDTQRFLREDILAALRIPKQMVDPDVNYNNSKAAQAQYMNNAVLPVVDTFIDVINNKFLPEVAPEVYFDYESPVNEDREQEVQEAKTLKKAGILTVNEARGLLDFPEIEGGDQRETQSTALEEIGNEAGLQTSKNKIKEKEQRKKAKRILKSRPTQRKKLIAIDKVKDLITSDVERERNSILTTEEKRREYLKAVEEKKDGYAGRFKQELDVYREGLKERIIEHQEELGMNPNEIIDTAEELSRGRKIFVPFFQNMFQSAGQESLDEVASGLTDKAKASESFNTSEELLKELEKRANFFLESMLQTDFDELKEIILDSMEQGEGIPELSRRIEEKFDEISKNRAKTIARTETSHVISKATHESYIQSNVVTGKEWISSRDNRVRKEHEENDGLIRAPQERYPNGERYPADDSINCRCALAPTV